MIEKSLEILNSIKENDSEEDVLNKVSNALKITPYCMEARIILTRIKGNRVNPGAVLEEGIALAEEEIRNNHTEEKVLRSYLRGLRELADCYIDYGRFFKAIRVILKLNQVDQEDRGGYRFKLMALLSLFENPDIEPLHDAISDGSVRSELPYLIYLYKRGDLNAALKVFDRFKDERIIRIFNGDISEKEDKDILDVFSEYSFLINTCPYFMKDLVSENLNALSKGNKR